MNNAAGVRVVWGDRPIEPLRLVYRLIDEGNICTIPGQVWNDNLA